MGVRTWEAEEAVIYAEAALRELAERYVIVEAAFDPWRFGVQALNLSKRGLRMVQFPQHDSRLVPAAKRRRSSNVGCAIPAIRCSMPTSAPRSRSRPHAARGSPHPGVRHTSNRIDAVIALTMAVDRVENRPEPVRLVGWL